MKLSTLKIILQELDQVEFILPNGDKVPEHFHVTEVGKIEKTFVDCGGALRKEAVINFQLWLADDYNHRLSAQKLNFEPMSEATCLQFALTALSFAILVYPS